MKKRIFSRLMAMVMAVVLLSTTGFAASFSALQDAIDGGAANDTTDNWIEESGRYGYAWNQNEGRWGIEAWNDGGTRNVELKESVTYGDGVEAGKKDISSIVVGGDDHTKDVSIDLNGNNIDGDGKVGTIIDVKAGGDLTLEDQTAETVTVTDEEGNATTQYESGKVTKGQIAVKVEQGGEFTLESGAISENNGYGGSGLSILGGTATMNGGSIDNNKNKWTEGLGGGVRVKDGGSFTMNDGIITKNNNQMGGGVSVSDKSTFTMTGGRIIGNTSQHGGGIFARNNGNDLPTLIIGTNQDNGKAVVISNNTANEFGGGICIWDRGWLYMDHALMENNKTLWDAGGAIGNAVGNGYVNVKNSIFHNNSAGSVGDVIARGYVQMDNCVVENDSSCAKYDDFFVDWRNSTRLNNVTLRNAAIYYVDGVRGQLPDGTGYTVNLQAGTSVLSDGFEVTFGRDNMVSITYEGKPVEDHVYDGTGKEILVGKKTDDDAIVSGMNLVFQFPLHLEHDWTAATCDTSSTCKICGVTNGGVDPNNHTSVVTDKAVAATCTTTGLTAGSHCEKCGATIVAQTETSALGHEYGEWYVTREAQPGVAGEERRNCVRGDAFETRAIEALPMPIDFGDDLGSGDAGIGIEDEATPLAGLFTRADAIGYLWEHTGSPEAELSTFPDVPEDHYWAVAIGWAEDNGIALPDEEGNFRPDDLVLRTSDEPEGELQEFLNRYTVFAGVELNEGELFFVLDGAADDVIMGEDAQVIFDAFFAKLEKALAEQEKAA